MAVVINTNECTSCGDCEPVCPTTSISTKKGMYVVNQATCTECDGEADSPKCITACPVDGCISYA
ncbi:MAG: 4Fe-4S binding protein [Pseudomonadota bacterium]